VLQRCEETLLGPPLFVPFGQYALTVRGDTKIPSFSASSSATRSSPQVGFSRTICTTSLRISFRRRGLPARDFHLQNSLKPFQCQRINVSGLTITNASFQSNRRDH